MAKTILVCGYGPGISRAVATKFGSEGFRVALAARSRDKLETATAELASRGIEAAAFPTDLSDPAAVEELLTRARAWSPITVLHWNAYPSAAPDLTTVSASELRSALDVGITSLVTAVQGALPDLRAQANAAVLVTGAGLALHDPKAEELAVRTRTMGLAIIKTAQHKIVGLLSAQLRADGIYVGEVLVRGIVKGTAFDTGKGTIEAASVADRFWRLYQERAEVFVSVFG